MWMPGSSCWSLNPVEVMQRSRSTNSTFFACLIAAIALGCNAERVAGTGDSSPVDSAPASSAPETTVDSTEIVTEQPAVPQSESAETPPPSYIVGYQEDVISVQAAPNVAPEPRKPPVVIESSTETMELVAPQNGTGDRAESTNADAPSVSAVTEASPEPAVAADPGPQIEPTDFANSVVEMVAAKPTDNETQSATINAADVSGDETSEAAEPDAYLSWQVPDVALVITGNQHGYLEPCGCTGLDRQKGGVARRFTFLEQLRTAGWNLVPIDAGNQVRRFGSQPEMKFHSTSTALRAMDYKFVGMGPDDIRLGVGELISETVDDGAVFASANVVLFSDPELMSQHRVIKSAGMKIGVTSVIDPSVLVSKLGDDVSVNPTVPATEAALKGMTADGATFMVLTYFGDEDAAQKLVTEVAGFDLLVVTGGYGEPTYQAQSIAGSTTKMIVTGNKGMYAGLVGLSAGKPLEYARVPLTHKFADAPEMRDLMKNYQEQLRLIGLEKLGLRPIPHPSTEKFVGSKTCGECHTTAFDIWESSPHFDATASLVKPPKERSDIPRHFDPECISCHVTGWNAQNYYPYVSGYLSLEESAHLTGNGCENCHGPGASHVAAEREDSEVTEDQRDRLRLAMQLPLEKAREKCMECHDLDNSPDFHDKDAFEDIYWPEIEHYGVD